MEVLTPEPLDAHFPVKKSAITEIFQDIQVTMPSLKPPAEVDAFYGADFEDYAVDLHEWLSLLLLNSPRIHANDKIDPYLSRYVPPGNSVSTRKMVKIKWRGFISAFWARDAFVRLLQAVPRDSWFAYCIDGFNDGPHGDSKSCTILKLPEVPVEYVLWEIA